MKARKEVKAMREAQQDQDEAEPEAAEKQPEEEANKEEIDISKDFFKKIFLRGHVSIFGATGTILFSL